MTDIWRSYFTQRLLWDVGSRIAFSTPWVTQYRNVHNYLADFNSEVPLYQQAGALVDALLAWRPETRTIPGRLEELYVLMYEMGILAEADVRLAQAWLHDLVKIGYRFPSIGHRRAGRWRHLEVQVHDHWDWYWAGGCLASHAMLSAVRACAHELGCSVWMRNRHRAPSMLHAPCMRGCVRVALVRLREERWVDRRMRLTSDASTQWAACRLLVTVPIRYHDEVHA